MFYNDFWEELMQFPIAAFLIFDLKYSIVYQTFRVNLIYNFILKKKINQKTCVK